MTKKEFAKLLSDKGIFISKAEAERKMDAILMEITNTLTSGEDVNFVGFGKFEVVKREERTGRNPKTGETIKIAARKSLKFKPGKNLTESVK